MPQTEPLVRRSSPYCQDMWGRYCCLTIFSDCRYVPSLRRYSPTKLCDGAQMASFWRFFASCIFSEPRVDIQSATAEIRRGKENRRKKKERKKKPQDENIISAPATQGGYKKNWNKNRVARRNGRDNSSCRQSWDRIVYFAVQMCRDCRRLCLWDVLTNKQISNCRFINNVI